MSAIENFNNIYSNSSSIIDSTKNAEYREMTNNIKKSYHPNNTNIIPEYSNKEIYSNKNQYNKEFFNIQKPNQSFVSQLTGTVIENFEHNNMQPFFKKTPNFSHNNSENILERHTGSSGVSFRKKTEVKNMFTDKKPDFSFVNGSPVLNSNNNVLEIIKGNTRGLKNNELPFEKVRIGPGLDDGFTNLPSGGFNQSKTRDIVIPKSVDQLRTKNNPKIEYEGRVIAGKKIDTRGLFEKFNKKLPNRFYKNDPSRYLVTGNESIRGPKMKENFYLKPVNKNHRQYFSHSKRETNKPMKQPAVKKSRKNNFMNPKPRNADASDHWTLTDEATKAGLGDYGFASIENKPNERDITQKRTVINNLTTEIKKAIVPVMDIFKKTRKQNNIGNIRPEGNLKTAMPAKLTVYDSNDVARTTIKETTIHDNRLGNLKGNVKNQVLDPNDVARTTIKETNIHNNDITTNFKPQQPSSLRVYDPEDVLSTTIKETTIDNSHNGFIESPLVNKTGSYNTSSFKAKNTHKQFLSDNEYTGVSDLKVGKGGGRGYLAARYKAKNTDKQFISDYEYTGNAKTYLNSAMSYSDKYNARINYSKEKTLIGRVPTKENAKIANGVDRINVQNKKLLSNVINTRDPSGQYIYQTPPTKNNCGLTQVKDKLAENVQRERINPDNLEAFRKNPYTKSLSSAF